MSAIKHRQAIHRENGREKYRHTIQDRDRQKLKDKEKTEKTKLSHKFLHSIYIAPLQTDISRGSSSQREQFSSIGNGIHVASVARTTCRLRGMLFLIDDPTIEKVDDITLLKCVQQRQQIHPK